MKPRYLFGAGAMLLAAGTANAQISTQPYCREFTQVVTIGGQLQPGYGQACYQPDGSWQVMSDQIPQSQPVQYIPTQNQVVYVPQPTPVSVFSFSLNSGRTYGNPYYTRYYNDHGHGWRGNTWNNGYRGYDRHDDHRNNGKRGRNDRNNNGHGRH